MLRFLSKTRARRIISFYLLIALLTDVLYPTSALALTGGPSTPEVQSFEPVSTSEMVDAFTGDFKYNIPLMDVGGYPINIAYNSGISTDQEASWVGLGWNLNVGNISRGMRGIPDDFNGKDKIKKEFNMKPNRTYGINAAFDFETFGKESKTKAGKKVPLKPRVGVGINYNNYTGFGVETSVALGVSAGVPGKGKLDAGLGLHSSTTGGLDISPNVSYSARSEKQIGESNDYLVKSGGATIGGSFNSRAGLKQLSFSANFQKSTEHRATKDEGTGKEDSHTVGGMGGRLSSGSTINFGLQTYIPHINMPMENNSVALSFKTGGHLFGIDGNITIGGYFSSQKLATNSMELPAYGYMYSEKGQNDNSAMMDFNREKDGSFSRFTKNLPLSNFTYDVYSAVGQGIGGTFRPFRHDYGHVFDNSGNSTSDSYSIGGEFSAGNLWKAGLNISVVDVLNKTSKWSDKNKSLEFFKFKDKSTLPTEKQDETYYFRSVGEKTADNTNLSMFGNLGGESAYAIKLKQTSSNSANISAEKKLVKFDNDANELSLSGSSSNSYREKRNQNFSILTMEEAALFGLQKNYYNNNTGVLDSKNTNPSKAFTDNNSHPHHIGEITVLNTEGARYIYGLPAYNKKQKEVNFNCSGLTFVPSNGFVNYNAGDASINNSRGIDNNFGSTEMPAYAYSYLLTAIVSVDYVDVTGDGPTDDDLGSYTKFHYTKAGGNSDYNWKMPATLGTPLANYSEGSKSKTSDQIASYSSGVKELWYLDEIETKNYIAVFLTKDRNDAIGVNNPGGTGDMGAVNTGAPGVKNKLLEKITLYSKPEYKAEQPGYPAVPIKVVNFQYDYSLCKGVTNNIFPGQGKLTLKSIFYTYGKSDRARFNNYNFTYNAFNPDYHPKAYDRWGNYKPEPAITDYSYGNTNLSNGEFPFTEQNKFLQDQYAQAWSLSKINLPSGGEINITYESDDYAFIQNVPVGQMFNVIGSSSSEPQSNVPFGNTPCSIRNLYTNNGGSYLNNLYLVVDGIPMGTTAADFQKYYLKDLNNENRRMFFKFLVNLTSPNATPASNKNFFEYVSGYAEISTNSGDFGTISGTNQAWIKLKDVPIKRQNNGDPINPVALAAIQFGRLNYGEQMWDKIANPPGDVEEALKQLANDAFGSLKTMVTGFKNPNKAIADKGYCQEFITHKSQIRLYNGNGKKLGGGARVKKLELNDNWKNMTTTGGGFQDNSSYGQEYEYTKTDEYGRTISSGVASYEPMIGGEENSMKQPRFFGNKNKWAMLAPDDRFFSEGPYGESFYPSPSIGYDKVKVKSIIPVTAFTDQKNGYKIYEYYTAKDYPTLTEETPIIPKQHRPPLGNLLKIFSRDFIYTSQGYVVRTNDMHGKPKAEIDYAEGKLAPMKEVRFYYKTKGGQYNEPTQRSIFSDAVYNWNELDNVCKVVQTNGSVVDKTIGVDFDAVADFRESETNSTCVGTQVNVSSFLVALVPAVFPTIWPSFSKEISRFRSAVLTKVVNQYGVLERTEVTENGSTISSDNLAYDAETGEVLVTKTKNGFSDDIYSLKYPSHWGYDLMGHAYKNLGITFDNILVTAGNANITNASTYLNIGDEIGVAAGGQNAWVCSIAGNSVGLIDRFGNPINAGLSTLKVIRSARRNLLTSDMASLTSLANPLVSSPISIGAGTKVLNANGSLYSDVWQMPKGIINSNAGGNCTCTTVSPTGLELITVLKNLFNNKNNSNAPLTPHKNGFLNGVTSPNAVNPKMVLNSTPPILGVNFTNGTRIWRATVGDLTPTPIINFGFAPVTTGYPDYNHYGFINGVLKAQLPSYLAAPGAEPFLGWAGPPCDISAGVSPFNASNQLIGYFMTNDPRCYVTMDFGAVNPWVVPGFQTLLGGVLNYVGLNHVNSINIIPDPNQTSCLGDYMNCVFQIHQTGNVGNVYYSTPVKISSTCLNSLATNCTGQGGAPVTYQCGKLLGELVNPFTAGIKGNWRPKINYSFLTGRIQTISPSPNTNTDIRGDGYFQSFSPLYVPNNTPIPSNFWTFNNTNWTNTVETTKCNQYGVEIENKDALGRYSAALYGYNESLPIAVASNARLREMAYDGFEDYSYYPSSCNKESHFTFMTNIYFGQTVRDSINAHTGKFSLKVAANNVINLSKSVSATHQAIGSNNSFCNYLLGDYDFIYPFSPVSASSNPNGVDYVISYWVKQNVPVNTTLPLNYVNSNISVTNNSNLPFLIKYVKRSPIIDGWQKEEYTFTIPTAYAGNMFIKLNNATNQIAYFDDIRLHPFSSNMKSYVYHPVTLKYVAELDANNFATFYEYDEQGNLVRVKKETEKGIMTIQESKTHYKNTP